MVSTPLPSGKVCDHPGKILGVFGGGGSFNTFTFWEGLRPAYEVAKYKLSREVSTPLPSGKVCDSTSWQSTGFNMKFQHLYLLGRSATPLFYIPCPERDPATICEGSQNLYSYAPKTAPQSPSNPCTAIHRGIERENQPLRAFSNLLDHTSEPTRSASLRRIVQNWMVSAIVINRSLINTC